MKNKEVKPKEELVTVSETALLSLVASKLNGRDLFPKKVETAKKHLAQVKFS